MMKKSWVWILLIGVGFSCLDTDLDATAVDSDSVNDYLGADNFNGLDLDPYHIIGITPDKTGWNVIVEYNGGCEDHQFYAIWSKSYASWSKEWTESQPIQTTIQLGHVGNNDPCDGVVKDTIKLDFDILFENTYPAEGAIVTLRNTPSTQEITVHPGLANIAQGNFCNINTKVVGTPCGAGIWSNKWLKVQDSVAYHDAVWFQPVTNNAAVSLEVPDDGDYDVGITLLFGYEFSIEGGICQAIPEGTIVPVSVNCLEKD